MPKMLRDLMHPPLPGAMGAQGVSPPSELQLTEQQLEMLKAAMKTAGRQVGQAVAENLLDKAQADTLAAVICRTCDLLDAMLVEAFMSGRDTLNTLVPPLVERMRGYLERRVPPSVEGAEPVWISRMQRTVTSYKAYQARFEDPFELP